MYTSVAMVTTFPYQQDIQCIVLTRRHMFTKYEGCTPLNAKVLKVSFQKTGMPKNMPRHLPGFVLSHSGEIAPLMPIRVLLNLSCLTPERVEQ